MTSNPPSSDTAAPADRGMPRRRLKDDNKPNDADAEALATEPMSFRRSLLFAISPLSLFAAPKIGGSPRAFPGLLSPVACGPLWLKDEEWLVLLLVVTTRLSCNNKYELVLDIIIMNAVAAIQHRHISSAFCSIIVLLRIAFFDRLESTDGADPSAVGVE